MFGAVQEVGLELVLEKLPDEVDHLYKVLGFNPAPFAVKVATLPNGMLPDGEAVMEVISMVTQGVGFTVRHASAMPSLPTLFILPTIVIIAFIGMILQ